MLSPDSSELSEGSQNSNMTITFFQMIISYFSIKLH